MDLRALIVHRLDKESNGVGVANLRQSLIPIEEKELEFINNVKETYYKKSNPNYGIFDSNTVSYPFQTMVTSYLSNETDFLTFTITAMEHYKSVINDVPVATGGYVIFSHYLLNQEEFLMTVMLNNSKKQFNINNDLSIDQLMSLDIDKLDMANSINITRWNNHENTYLSFARGRKQIANYFKRFIGCTDQTSAQQASENLKRAFLDYVGELDLETQAVEELRNRVFNYCTEKIKRKEDISLSHISSMIDEENPNLFSEFASSEEYSVNPMIKGHTKTLKNLKFYVFRSKNLTLEFDSSLVANHTITYNRESNELLIRNVPEALKIQFMQNDEQN